MDIVTRLKAFIEHTSMPVTQFADSAAIPRPTLSQILNGRNKKISNEILEKLHTGFPNLNILWLMFGDGNMLSDRDDVAPNKLPDIDLNADSGYESPEPELEHTQRTPRNDEDAAPKDTAAPQAIPNISLIKDSSKKIQNIMVFYTDSSFEIFVPSGR